MIAVLYYLHRHTVYMYYLFLSSSHLLMILCAQLLLLCLEIIRIGILLYTVIEQATLACTAS